MEITSLKTTALFCLLLFSLVSQSQETNRELYQLKTYTFANEAQEQITDSYLQNAFLPALKRQGISNIGVFKLRPGYTVTSNKTYVLIPFSDLKQVQDVEDKLAKDKAHLTAGKDYLNASHDQAPYRRIASVLMRAFRDMPTMASPKLEGNKQDRVYELRSYESPNESYYQRKVHMFNEGGEITLFDSLGFNAVFYAEVLSGDKMPNLMYMTTFDDMESRDAHWKAFFNAPKWLEIKDLPQYKNTVSHADIILLYPTEYSDY